MGMKDLNRDAVSRSIDHNDKMQRYKDSEFSGWDDLKFGIGVPLVFIILVASVIGLAAALWGSLR